MAGINWLGFDGNYFQKFCNALIVFEVSKFAKVFTAAGKDGGVDQLYSGTYHGKSGKWRFQDKFHFSERPSGDIAAFKKDVTNDIADNYNGEDFIVYITNVNPSPIKLKEIEKAADQELAKKGMTGCTIIIWPQGHIEALLAQFPVLVQQFWEKDTILLQSIDDYFALPLKAAGPETRYQLSNAFFGREDAIQQLDQFLHKPTQPAMAIAANGGYGKTRLVIEFIRQCVDKKDDWLPFVLSHTGFNANRFAQLVNTKRNILVIIDNAHECPELVNEVKRQVENSSGRFKLLLTTRNTLFADIIKKMASHHRNIEKIELGPLSYNTRKQLIAFELSKLREQYVIHLAEISKGVPNVMLEMIRLVRNGRQPGELSAETTFTDSVKEIFGEAIENIHKNTGIPKHVLFDFIKLVALISPVPQNDDNLELIAQITGLRFDQVELIITSLQELLLLDNKPIIAIKPDPYSDALVNAAILENKAFIKRIKDFPGADGFLENILKNLVEAEVDLTERNQFIDKLLLDYVSAIADKTTKPASIKRIYEFVKRLGPKKIAVALYAIRQFYVLYADKSNSLHSERDGWAQKKYIDEVDELVFTILSEIATYSAYALDQKEEIFGLVREFALLTGNHAILHGCYGYHEWNFTHRGFRPRVCAERQQFLQSKLSVILETSTSAQEIDMALVATKFLLAIEFRLQDYFEKATMRITFGTDQVPGCPHILSIRTGIVQSLILFVEKGSGTPVQLVTAFDELLGLLFYATNASQEKYKQDLRSETQLVIDFFAKRLQTVSNINERAQLISYIRRYVRKGYRTEFKDAIAQLQEKASLTSSTADKLKLLLLSEGYQRSDSVFETDFIKVVDEYADKDQFVREMLSQGKEQPNGISQYYRAMGVLSKQKPQLARQLFSLYQKEYVEGVPQALELVRYQYKDEAYFYEVVKWLWKQKETFIGSIIWLLTYGRQKDISSYRETDLQYFAFAIREKLQHTFDTISFSLIDYAYVDSAATFALLDEFLASAAGKDISSFFALVFEDSAAYKNDFRTELKSLLETNIAKIELGEIYLQHILEFIDLGFGFDALLAFLDKRIDLALTQSPHRSLNPNNFIYNSNKVSREERVSRFLTIAEHAISAGPALNKQHQYLLELFRPDYTLSDELKQALVAFTQKNKDNKEVLTGMAAVLQVFSYNTENWIWIISMMSDTIRQTDSSFEDYEKLFGASFKGNGTGRTRSGHHIPYDEDRDRKELLENVLAKNEFPAVRPVLQACLDYVNKEIAKTMAEDADEFDDY